MKHFLIVTTSQYEMSKYYNFIVDAVSPISTMYYTNSKNHARVETKDFIVDVIVEGYYPLPNVPLENYLYLGHDQEYEDMLKPLLIKSNQS